MGAIISSSFYVVMKHAESLHDQSAQTVHFQAVLYNSVPPITASTMLIVGALASANDHALIVKLSFKKKITFLMNTHKHCGYILAVISLALIMSCVFLSNSYLLMFSCPHIIA